MVTAAMAIIAIAIKILAYLLPLVWQCLTWIALTIYDLCVYGVQQLRMWRARWAARP